jgi:hypothetical protein
MTFVAARAAAVDHEGAKPVPPKSVPVVTKSRLFIQRPPPFMPM